MVQKLKYLVIGIVSLVLGSAAYFVLTRADLSNTHEVTWELLGQLDYISGKPSAELESLNNKSVKIPGFMVPLEDQMQKVKEFLLVPTPQACIHVPPPPPNQMVYISMHEPVEAAYGPIWVYGVLKIGSKKHMYGESSFQLEGISIEPYR